MTLTNQAAMASTMPVPLRTPVRTAAAMTIETTATILPAWATSALAWSFIFGKLTTKAMAEPTMNTYGNGRMSMTRTTMSVTVRTRLNQKSLGRSVSRFGSSWESASEVLTESAFWLATASTCSSKRVCAAERGFTAINTAEESAEPASAGLRDPPEGVPASCVEVPVPEVAVPRFPEVPLVPAASGASSLSALPTHRLPARARRRRSRTPRCQAKKKITIMPAMRDGIMGTKTSLGETFRAAAARAVGPPHGRMFMVPLARPATQVRMTGLMPRRK